MSDNEHVTVTENTAIVRDPVTGEARQTIERTIVGENKSSWALWVAGVAVFGAVLVIALVLLGQNNNQTDAEVLAAQAETEAARIQAEQAILDANQARMDAAVNGMGSQAANAAAANSAAAAEAAANRAAAAAESSARTPPTVIVQSPPSSDGGMEDLPPTQ